MLSGPSGFTSYVTREQLKNYGKALDIVKERMGAKAFKTAWDYNYSYNNFANSLPTDAALNKSESSEIVKISQYLCSLR